MNVKLNPLCELRKRRGNFPYTYISHTSKKQKNVIYNVTYRSFIEFPRIMLLQSFLSRLIDIIFLSFSLQMSISLSRSYCSIFLWCLLVQVSKYGDFQHYLCKCLLLLNKCIIRRTIYDFFYNIIRILCYITNDELTKAVDDFVWRQTGH